MGISEPSSSISFFPAIQHFTLAEIAIKDEADECIKTSLMKNEYSTELLYA